MHPGILFTMVKRDHEHRRRQQALERHASEPPPVAHVPAVPAAPALPTPARVERPVSTLPLDQPLPLRGSRQGARL